MSPFFERDFSSERQLPRGERAEIHQPGPKPDMTVNILTDDLALVTTENGKDVYVGKEVNKKKIPKESWQP
jgi:hypothetical protein